MGATAGTLAVTFTYPSDLIRRKLQLVSQPGYPVYTGLIDCATKIILKDGFVGLYRGIVPCYLKVVPAMAIMFWCNERLKKQFNV